MDNNAPATKAKLISFSLITLLCSIIALALIYFNPLDNLENRTWDWRLQALANKSPADPKIKLILIDQASLEYFAKNESIFWPWPRSIYTRIIDFLKLSQAKAVAFDIMFSEDSHYSVDEDNLFAASMQSGLPVVSATALLNSKTEEDPLRLEAFFNKQKQIASNASKYRFKNDPGQISITLPIIQILNSTTMLGNVSSENELDGVFRYGSAGNLFKDTAVFSLPFALFEASKQPLANSQLPYNEENRLALRFSANHNSFPRYSFAAIYSSLNRLEQGMQPQIEPQEFKDSFVFVGMSAPGLLDLRPTPINSKAPGVEVNATALDNLLNNKFIAEFSDLNNWLFSCLFIVCTGLAIFFSRSASMQIFLCILTLLAIACSSLALAFSGFWVQLVIAMLTNFICMLLSTAEQYRLEGAQSRFIKKAFKYYVSPEVIDKIISNPDILKLGGDKRELSIFFCDIAGFTSISESMDPTRLVLFLNKFLSAMTSTILKHGGTVDKYVGDAIVAFWNAPLPTQDHAIKAVNASIECQQILEKMRPDFKKEFNVDVFLRIGLNTGSVSVGNFGSAERFNYTVIGDAANLASRLEGANKMFGTDILFAEDTMLGLNNTIETTKLARIKVVGKDHPIWVYTTNKIFSEQELLIWDKFLDAFVNAEIEAAKNCLAQLPESKLTKAYKKYLEEHTEKADWSGVLQLSEK